MLNRFAFPVLLSVAGLLFFLLPITSANNSEENSIEMYTGNNTFSCDAGDIIFDPNDTVLATISHDDQLFYLNLWIGGYENRITFVLRGEQIKEGAFELDDPSKRHISFLYQGKDCTYASDDYYTGMLMIHKYDTTNKIIAGSFEFMAHAQDCNELIRVKDGKFDATYVLN